MMADICLRSLAFEFERSSHTLDINSAVGEYSQPGRVFGMGDVIRSAGAQGLAAIEIRTPRRNRRHDRRGRRGPPTVEADERCPIRTAFFAPAQARLAAAQAWQFNEAMERLTPPQRPDEECDGVAMSMLRFGGSALREAVTGPYDRSRRAGSSLPFGRNGR